MAEAACSDTELKWISQAGRRRWLLHASQVQADQMNLLIRALQGHKAGTPLHPISILEISG